MSLIDDLVSALQVLPGVGPKSAQRMALHLLQRNRQGGAHLGQILETAMDEVQAVFAVPKFDGGRNLPPVQ